MKTACLMVAGVSILVVSPASAYDLRKPDGTPGCPYALYTPTTENVPVASSGTEAFGCTA